MASQADDSSVDGTVSSVGESTWDMIDGDSVASEEVAFIPPQQSTSASEGLESVHVPQPSPPQPSDVRSASSDASDEEEEAPDHILQQPHHSLEATPVTVHANRTETSTYGGESSYLQEMMGTIHLEDVLEIDSRLGIKIASTQVCTSEEMTRERLRPRHHGREVTPLWGRIQMGLKDGGLEVRDTFKLLYCGPKELKSAITQKIGSALAANPRRPLLNDGPASSRVTVVPISSFIDESSPEVVMIESGGFDMIIEECIGAHASGADGITMEVESGNTMECRTNRNESDTEPAISAPTGVPDLGIIYLPDDSSTSRPLSQERAQSFALMQRFFLACGIPYYVISDIDWFQEPKIPIIGSYRLVPHRSAHVLDRGNRCTIPIPIDMTMFLALDASQLHQNLVALKSSALHEPSSSWKDPRTLLTEVYDGVKRVSKKAGELLYVNNRFGPKTMISVAVILLIALLVQGTVWLHGSTDTLNFRNGLQFSQSVPINQEALSKLGMTKFQLDARMKASAPSLANVLAAETQHSTVGVPGARKKDSMPHNDSQSGPRDVLVRVIGKSNILVRSFKSGSGPKNLKFETKRDGQIVSHQLQKIDNEYSVLEIPAPDAYGLIQVRIWTNSRPKYNETFEIDFGLPWFSLQGWKDLAGTTANRAAQQLHDALQDGLVQTLKTGGQVMEDLKAKDNVVAAFEKFAASLADMERAALSGSHRMFRGNLRQVRKARRQFSRLARKARRAARRQSSRAFDQQVVVSAHMREAMRAAFDKATKQQVRCAKALHSIRKAAASQHYRKVYTEKLRQTQKRLLHAWWKMRGNPTQGRAIVR